MKLYLVTRRDLSPGQQAVQAAHALREFVSLHPAEDAAWYSKSNTLALLAAADEPELESVVRRAAAMGLPHAPFHEPDRGDELTAVAIGPSGKSVVKHLPLALV